VVDIDTITTTIAVVVWDKEGSTTIIHTVIFVQLKMVKADSKDTNREEDIDKEEPE
jgi:hypothetical protein